MDRRARSCQKRGYKGQVAYLMNMVGTKKALRSTPERKVKVAEPSAKKQFAVIAKNGEIQAIVLVRDAGFYCFEQSQQPPKNMSELMKLYQECELIELELKQKWESAP
jgi:hypothetical protein